MMVTIVNPEVLDDYVRRYSNLTVSHFENGFTFVWLVDGDIFKEHYTFKTSESKKNLNIELTPRSVGRLLPPPTSSTGFDMISSEETYNAIDQIRLSNGLNMAHRYDRVSNHLVIISITFS